MTHLGDVWPGTKLIVNRHLCGSLSSSTLEGVIDNADSRTTVDDFLLGGIERRLSTSPSVVSSAGLKYR